MLILITSVILVGIAEKINLFTHPNRNSIILILTLAFVTIIVITFSKKGILISEGNIFKTNYFAGRIIYKIRIEKNNKNVVSVLSAKAMPALGYSITDRLDFKHSMTIFKIFLLNKNHSDKKLIISVNSKENAEKTISFLTENNNCVFENYNPKKQ